jgi:hypothetical protein
MRRSKQHAAAQAKEEAQTMKTDHIRLGDDWIFLLILPGIFWACWRAVQRTRNRLHEKVIFWQEFFSRICKAMNWQGMQDEPD